MTTPSAYSDAGGGGGGQRSFGSPHFGASGTRTPSFAASAAAASTASIAASTSAGMGSARSVSGRPVLIASPAIAPLPGSLSPQPHHSMHSRGSVPTTVIGATPNVTVNSNPNYTTPSERHRQLHPAASSTPGYGNGSSMDAHSPLPPRSKVEAAIAAAEADPSAIHGPFKILASVRELWALGIVTVLGGHYFSWNPGLKAGMGTFSIATGLISFAYLALVMCLAEMSSCLQVPFAGNHL
jgi:hypothetical protein